MSGALNDKIEDIIDISIGNVYDDKLFSLLERDLFLIKTNFAQRIALLCTHNFTQYALPWRPHPLTE